MPRAAAVSSTCTNCRSSRPSVRERARPPSAHCAAQSESTWLLGPRVSAPYTFHSRRVLPSPPRLRTHCSPSRFTTPYEFSVPCR